MCFHFSPGKRETHKQFDPHPFPGQSREIVYVYWLLRPLNFPCKVKETNLQRLSGQSTLHLLKLYWEMNWPPLKSCNCNCNSLAKWFLWEKLHVKSCAWWYVTSSSRILAFEDLCIKATFAWRVESGVNNTHTWKRVELRPARIQREVNITDFLKVWSWVADRQISGIKMTGVSKMWLLIFVVLARLLALTAKVWQVNDHWRKERTDHEPVQKLHLWEVGIWKTWSS